MSPVQRTAVPSAGTWPVRVWAEDSRVYQTFSLICDRCVGHGVLERTRMTSDICPDCDGQGNTEGELRVSPDVVEKIIAGYLEANGRPVLGRWASLCRSVGWWFRSLRQC